MKTYYEVLGIAASATPDEIKRTFRREISKYHPDKVQHLGHEFQEMAAVIAADLTEAYRVLMDPALRAKYDAELEDGATPFVEPSEGAPPPRRPEGEPAPYRRPEPPPAPSPADPTTRDVPQAGIELVRKATLARLKVAAEQVLGAQARSVHGFDAAFQSPARKGLFKKQEPAIRLLIKLVPSVDGEAVAQVWPKATAVAAPGLIVAVMLLGSGMASPRELSRAVTDLRQATGEHGPVVIPVDVRDWEALLPGDAPPLLRLLLERLRSNHA